MRLGETDHIFYPSPINPSLSKQYPLPPHSPSHTPPPPTPKTADLFSRHELPKISRNIPHAHSLRTPLPALFDTRLHSLSADLLNIKDSFIPESLCGQLAVKATGCLVRGSFELLTITGRLPADSKSNSIATSDEGVAPTPYVLLSSLY